VEEKDLTLEIIAKVFLLIAANFMAIIGILWMVKINSLIGFGFSSAIFCLVFSLNIVFWLKLFEQKPFFGTIKFCLG
jgi:hypothetical protein